MIPVILNHLFDLIFHTSVKPLQSFVSFWRRKTILKKSNYKYLVKNDQEHQRVKNTDLYLLDTHLPFSTYRSRTLLTERDKSFRLYTTRFSRLKIRRILPLTTVGKKHKPEPRIPTPVKISRPAQGTFPFGKPAAFASRPCICPVKDRQWRDFQRKIRYGRLQMLQGWMIAFVLNIVCQTGLLSTQYTSPGQISRGSLVTNPSHVNATAVGWCFWVNQSLWPMH